MLRQNHTPPPPPPPPTRPGARRRQSASSALVNALAPLVVLLILLGIAATAVEANVERPNIVIIMADDLGFDDVSFRGSNRFLTPHIDALAYSGVILNNLYTPAMCTPSRAALLTGKYPINTGMQHFVIVNDQPWGLPLNETTMAQVFHANGYHTSLIGKWHLGMSRRAQTPTMRGFDQHYGYLGSYIDYYTHTLYMPEKNYSRGHDFRENLAVSRRRSGTYATEVLTDAAVELIGAHDVAAQPLFLLLSHLAPHSGNDDYPLQAPDDELQKFAYIKDVNRRTYAAMVSLLDKSVGRVIDALGQRGILNNTIVVFFSDNGGPTVGMHATTASNRPLRGQKYSPWEGGVRSSAAIWSPQFEKLGTVWRQKIYIADFLPTLAAAAGIQLDAQLTLDGLNLWSALRYGYESVEREIVHNIDEIDDYVSYAKGKWKFINGTTQEGIYDGWLGGGHDDDDDSAAAEFDPRTPFYEELVRNTSVWQQLHAFRPQQGNEQQALELELDATVTGLRTRATIVCQFANASEGLPCRPLEAPCLFDVDEDPCEQNNLYEQYRNTKIVQELLKRVEHFRRSAHAPNNKPADPNCDPKYFHGEWTWWEDESRSSAGFTDAYLFVLLSTAVAHLLLGRLR